MAFKILYIEDNPTNMQLVRKMLRSTEYQLLEATNARTGLETAKSSMPDLILMDIGLPNVSGLQAAAQIKALPRLAHIPIIALTADTSHDTFERAMSAGCLGILNKPISRFILLDTLQRYLSVTQAQMPPQTASHTYRHLVESKPAPMKHVLIAEDSADLRKIFGHVFNKQHFSVQVAVDGLEALEALRTTIPDILVLDINMPNLSGLEVLTYVRQQPSMQHIKIIVVSGNSLAVQYPEISEADLFLVKPVNLNDLVSLAQGLLAS